MNIYSPIVSGSGVQVVHAELQAQLRGYAVHAISPYWSLVPPARTILPAPDAPITHSLPELGPWHAHPDSLLIETFHNYYLDEEVSAYASPLQRTYYRTVLGPAVRAALRRSRWVTAVSHTTADLVQRNHHLGERLVVIRNGVDTELFTPAPRPERDFVKVLFSGNPTRRKGFNHFGALAQTLPVDVVFAFTKGTRRTALETGRTSARVVSIPLTEHRQMPGVYQDADILFFPSVREGLSLALAEAMACGLPVVAARASSIPEMIDHGKGGFLFEPGNHNQMREYLVRLAKSPQLRAEMGDYNRRKCQSEFTVNRMVDEYRQIFEACGVIC